MPGQETTKIFTRSALAVAVSAACGGAQTAHAQAPQLEEIIVTATKREASLQDVPLAVTAFTEDDIARQGLVELDDYVGKIPGLSFSRREPGGTTVLMRGCVISGLSYGTNSTTSVYLDEQPVTASGQNPDVRLIDIERVEALSGPQGTLFGDASQCGSLRIITNKPDAGSFAGWIDAGVNQVTDGDTGYSLSGMVNVPLVEDRVALRLVGFLDEEAGFVDNVLGTSPGGTFDNAAFVEEDVNSSTNTGGRVSLRAAVSDTWAVDATAIYQKSELDGFGDVDLDENFLEANDIGDLQQVRFNEEFSTDEWYQIGLSAEGSVGFADLLVTGAFFTREVNYQADGTTYHFAFDLAGQAYDAQNIYYDTTIYDFGGDPHGLVRNQEEDDRWSFEARLSTPADSASRWSGIVGLFYNREENYSLFFGQVEDFETTYAFTYLNYLALTYDPSFPVPAPPSGGNWFTGVYDSTIEQKALFGEVGFEVTDDFRITVGGRFYDIDADRTLVQGALFPVGTEPDCSVDFCVANDTGSDSETGFAPKLTFDYHPNDDTMLYFTYSEGFRRGGANAGRVTSVFGPGQPFSTFDSDIMTNYELGLKSTWADGRFRLNAVGYHMVWEDIQLQAEDPAPLLFTLGIVNFPEAEIDGVELQASWLPAERWSVDGTLGWNDGEISEGGTIFAGTEEPKEITAGTSLPIMPDWKGSLGIEYTFARELLDGNPYIRVDSIYRGEALSSVAGIQSLVFENPVRTMDAYSVTDLRFGIEAEAWSAALYVSNVFDERAEEYFNDRWAQTRLSINQPLTVGVSYRRYFE